MAARLLFRCLVKFAHRLKTSIEFAKYDNYSIAEYFRRQGAQIGENCYIVPRHLGTEPYLLRIGNHVAIAAGVGFHTHDGATWIFREQMPDLRRFGPIIIKDNCIIGANAHLLPNVTIGPNAIVAPASVVITDVPADTMVMGVPARPIGSIHKYREKCIEIWRAQRPPDVPLEYFVNPELSGHQDALAFSIRKHLIRVLFQNDHE